MNQAPNSEGLGRPRNDDLLSDGWLLLCIWLTGASICSILWVASCCGQVVLPPRMDWILALTLISAALAIVAGLAVHSAGPSGPPGLRGSKRSWGERLIALLSLAAACLFLASLLNPGLVPDWLGRALSGGVVLGVVSYSARSLVLAQRGGMKSAFVWAGVLICMGICWLPSVPKSSLLGVVLGLYFLTLVRTVRSLPKAIGPVPG